MNAEGRKALNEELLFALDAAVPVTDAELTPAQVNLLARILGIGAASGGVVAGGATGR